MMRLAKLRMRVPEYLLYGTFVRPPQLDVEKTRVALSRVSIYAARDGGPTVSEATFPAAIAGAWRADDGSIGIAVASIVDEPRTVMFEVDPRDYGLTGGGTVERLDAEGSRELGAWDSTVVPVRLELPARGAAVVALRVGDDA